MLRVGLTGGIGSGKSEVARRLSQHGAVLIDADVAARKVVEPGSPGLAQVAAAFGEGVLRPDGALDRERLGEIVFGDPGLRAKLNAIVHPLVRGWMEEAERSAVRADGDAIVVHDVPLLAESRGKAGFDAVIVVDVPPELQVERLVTLRGMPEDQARARLAAQASREQRLAVADIVIDNSGSLAGLDRRVAEVWADLQRRNQPLPRAGAGLPRHREQRPRLASGVQPVAGHTRRTLLPDLVRSLRTVILGLGLSDERELAEVDRAVREHLADPRTVVMPHLLMAVWARKAA